MIDELIDRWQAAWVGRDRAAFVPLCTPDIHYEDPLAMARAIRLGTEAGRLAYRAGRIPRRLYAQASTPEDGVAEF